MRAPWLLVFALACAACQSDRPAVEGLRIEGNEEVDEDDLIETSRRYLDAYAENDGRMADADDAAYAMESLLRERGYPEAEVGFEKSPGALVFQVEEGPRAYFGRVRFEGVKAIDVAELESFFEFEGSGFLQRDPPLLEPARVTSAISAVESRYLALGYRRVEVKRPELVWNVERTEADVEVVVIEGPLYTLEAVEIEGVPESYVSAEEHVGKPYHPRLPRRLARKVRQRVRSEGHATAAVRSTAQIDDEAHTVRIQLAVEKGDVCKFGELHVTGNESTSDAFIRGRFDLTRGQTIDADVVDRGVADLYRSRLFRRVSTRYEPLRPGRTDIHLNVEEAESKRLDIEVGFGSYDLLYGGVKFKEFDFAGTGRILRIAANGGVRGVGGEIQLEDPWILGADDSVLVQVAIDEREEPFYDYTGFEAELRFEHRLERGKKIWGGYRFALERAQNIAADIDPLVEAQIDDFERAAGLFVNGRLDTRDDRFLPTSGWLVEAGLLWSAPALGATLSFVELDARAVWHRAFGKSSVLAVGASLGTTHATASDILPLSRRRFLGGQQSVRSFGQDELTPTDADGDGLGGLTTFEGHIEWRQRLFDVLHAAFFYDVGLVGPESFDFRRARVGHGVGAGLRFYTPVGPIRFDVAHNPGELHAASDRWQLHFSFGFSF